MSDEELIEHIKQAYDNAQANKSGIENEYRIKDLYSISSLKFKHLLNNICSLPGSVYLEIGCFKGGTLVSALFNNKLVAAYAIDNFSYDPLSVCENPATQSLSNFNPAGWANIKLDFIENLERFNLDKSVKLFVGDWSAIPGSFIKHSINIIHIDLTVDVDIEKVLRFYDPKLTNTFTLILSNYNETSVRDKFHKFVDSRKHLIKYGISNLSHSNSDSSKWWNGLGLFVIEKMGNIDA